MPAVVITDPAGITGISCTFSDGSGFLWQARNPSDPVLVGELLNGLANLVHPHGPVDAKKTVQSYGFIIRDVARRLTGLGHRGPLAGLRRSHLNEALLGLGHREETTFRRVLAA